MDNMICKIKFLQNDIQSYTLDDYLDDINKNGIEFVWATILSIIEESPNISGILSLENLSELYEVGLAHEDKDDKKGCGKYYTPKDVAQLMSQWLFELKGENICDVCCGTGNLILSYFEFIGQDKAKSIMEEGKVFLYDQDEVAMHICKAILRIKYGNSSEMVNFIIGDFLDKNVILPRDSKVISNPPYFRIKDIKPSWENTKVAEQNKEIYSLIMEKIIKQSVASVIISPYSFLGGQKFSSFREFMGGYGGFIVSFDNIPGSIFNGRKHGVFNSNLSNSVRAAITVTTGNEDLGYQISPLIRFKNEERSLVLDKDFLNMQISKNKQNTCDGRKFYKCDRELEDLFNEWYKSEQKLKDIILNESKYCFFVPNTCRYYTVASVYDLHRTGKIKLCFKNEDDMLLAYAFMNSSFAYWHWRLWDGGITYAKSLLLNIPIFFDQLSKEEKECLISIAKEMILKEKDFLSYKKNAGDMQENIKFDKRYIEKINGIWLSALNYSFKNIEKIHKNSIT